MKAAPVLVVMAAALLVAIPDAWGATLTAFLEPEENEGTFTVSYLQTFTIRHDGEGMLSELLNGEAWEVERKFYADEPGVIAMTERINSNILAERSSARVEGLEVSYEASLKPRDVSSDINFRVDLSGNLVDFVIKAEDPTVPGIADMGWRHFALAGPVVIEGIDINTPLTALEENSPEIHEALGGTPASELLSDGLMAHSEFADPLDVWHFLVDPTGINIDAAQFGLSEEILGKVISKYTLGESSIREGRKTDDVINLLFTLDREYHIRTIKTIDLGEIAVVGYTSISSLDDLETLGFSREPIGTTTSTGQFPVLIVYGMAAVAAIGAGMFFFISSRQLKKEEGATQTGIDPANLQASATSTAAGGYQTNRGESQLRSDYGSGPSTSPELSGPESTRGSMPKGWEKK